MNAKPWAVVPLQTGTAAHLLADGVARYERLGPDDSPTLRWYRSVAPAIVLGRGQGDVVLKPGRDPVTTRFSGGGAVWMAPDVLCLDVLIPRGHPWFTDRLTDVFDLVGQRWAEALRRLDVDDVVVYDGPATARRRGTDHERLLAAICYATRGRGEVLWRERKLVGLAQRRRRHGLMVQCGLLRRWEPEHLLRYLGADPTSPEILNTAVGLDEVLAQPPDDEQVMSAVISAFRA
jgi:lipoate-protein ligase A